MKKQPFILEKRCSFLLPDIEIFIDFLFKKRRRPNGAEVTVASFPSSKKIKRNSPKNLIVSFIKLKSAKKDKILLECVVSTPTTENTMKGVLVTKGKLKSDLSTISDLIRDENM